MPTSSFGTIMEFCNLSKTGAIELKINTNILAKIPLLVEKNDFFQ